MELYAEAVTATLLTLFVLLTFGFVEKKFLGK